LIAFLITREVSGFQIVIASVFCARPGRRAREAISSLNQEIA
jgi:hypothetical protein